VRKQRLEKLKERDPDTFKAVQWLEMNRDKFTGQVHEPVLLAMNLKDSNYASAIETILGGAQGPHLKVRLNTDVTVLALPSPLSCRFLLVNYSRIIDYLLAK
jgi:hypothetical protein